MTSGDFINLCIAALLLAGIYAAMSVGMTIIYGVMKIVNLAHAGFLMLGAYMAFELYERFHIDPLVGAVLTLPVFFVFGVVVFYLLVRRLPKSNEPTLSSLLLMFGLWLVLQNFAYLIWQNEDRSIDTPLTISVIHLGDITIPTLRLIIFAAAVISVVILEVVLHRTWFGKSVGALIQNPYAAQVFGVDDRKTSRMSFGLGTGFAGFAGALLATIYSFSPDFGRPFLLRAFVIIVLGGLESASGVALGAMVLAFVETFSINVPLPWHSREGWSWVYLPASYQPAVAYALLVVVLLILPGGIAGLLKKRKLA
jgi:branched-chain amino acid transport system permease protein